MKCRWMWPFFAAIVAITALPAQRAVAQPLTVGTFADLALVGGAGMAPGVNARIHLATGPRHSFGIDLSYTNLGNPQVEYASDAAPVWVAQNVGRPATLSLASFALTGKMRSMGEQARVYALYGVGLYERRDSNAQAPASALTRAFGGMFGFGFEGTRTIAPAMEVRVRWAQGELDPLSLVDFAVGLNWNR